jgi:hypothetical protein
MKDANLFSCFIGMGQVHPEVYVVPAIVVARVIKEIHSTWLKTAGKRRTAT